MKYNELASVPIKDKRRLVISECSAGGFTLAQQMIVNEDGKEIKIFLKNAIQVDDFENLVGIKEAIEKIIDIKSQKNP